MEGIRKEYNNAAKKADMKYFGTENGPVSLRLAAVGPIYGMAWGRPLTPCTAWWM